MFGRREIDRLTEQLAEERRRVADLTRLLMAREAPQEFAAYLDPNPSVPAAPVNRVWSDDGLYYVDLDAE